MLKHLVIMTTPTMKTLLLSTILWFKQLIIPVTHFLYWKALHLWDSWSPFHRRPTRHKDMWNTWQDNFSFKVPVNALYYLVENLLRDVRLCVKEVQDIAGVLDTIFSCLLRRGEAVVTWAMEILEATGVIF